MPIGDLLKMADAANARTEREDRFQKMLQQMSGGLPQEEVPEPVQEPQQKDPTQEAVEFVEMHKSVPPQHHTSQTAMKFHESLLQVGNRKGAKAYRDARAKNLSPPQPSAGLDSYEASVLGWTNELIRDEKIRQYMGNNLKGLDGAELRHLDYSYDQKTGQRKPEAIARKDRFVSESVKRAAENHKLSPAVLQHLEAFVSAKMTESQQAMQESRSPREVDWEGIGKKLEADNIDIPLQNFQWFAIEALNDAIKIDSVAQSFKNAENVDRFEGR